jgi:glycosyltransferase involved in cell wall biosynthesis
MASGAVDSEAGQPLVSVVMPVYNGERFLSEAIESVLAQTYARWQLVLIDDGSTDGSAEIAAKFARRDARVRFFANARNLGIVATRNRAFDEADPATTYFAIMDGDDVCMPDRFARQVEFLESHSDHALVGGNTLVIDERGSTIGRRIYPSTHLQIANVITRYNPIAQPTAMLRRSALEHVGRYDTRYPRCQDYDLWLRIAARFKVANLETFTLKYRVSSTQGKVVQLRDSLRFTIAIQREWLFHAAFFRPSNVAYWALEHGLLLLPDRAILALFKTMTYQRSSV